MSPILSRLNWAQGFGRRPFVPSGSAIFNNIEDYFSTYNYYGAAVNASYIQEFVGAPTPSTDCPFTGEGEGYNSVEFGLNKTIEITQNGRFNFGSNTSFTVEWWEKRFPLNSGSAIEKDPYMTVMDIGGTSGGLLIGLNGTNQGKYYITIGNGGTVLATEGTGVAADSGWHHYALAVDGLGGNLTQFKFFRDGVETAGTTTNSTDWGASNSDWTVGGQKAYPQNYNFQGRISNFRVTSGICRYKSNFSVPTKPFSDWADGTNTNTLFVCCKSASVLGADGDIFANGGLTKKTRVKYFDEGGMVWIKSRTQGNAHFIIDTVRGHTKYLEIGNSAQGTDTGGVVAMTGDGFSVGSDLRVNNSGYFYTSWSFAKNSKIFDLIEYTGNGATSRYIDHSLDGKPGFLLIKNLDQSGTGWVAIHKNAEQSATPGQGVCQWNDSTGTIWNIGDTPADNYPSLGGPDNRTNQFHVTSNWNNWENSSGSGYMGTNNNGEKYIAYVFAHDESENGMIRCGYFNTDGNGTAPANTGNSGYTDLGWEPQWIMTKEVCEDTTGYPTTSGDWEIWDDKRGVGLYTRYLRANNSDTEQGMMGGKSASFRARGFRFTNFGNGRRFIYVAIRKGLMGDPKDTKRKAIDLFALARGGSSTSTYHGNNGGFITQVADGGETTEATGQQEYTTPGSYTWTCPANVTKVHAVCIGGGGGGESDDFKAGGGGGLGWKNNIPVIPGQTYTVVVGDGGTQSAAGGNDGGDSYFINATTVKGGKGKGANQGGGDFVGDGGGNGGTYHTYGGGGGAGGYSGDGNSETGGSAGRGSANGLTGGGAGGGGVGIMGEGSSGANKPWNNNYGQTMEGGGGGSGGADGTDGTCPTFSGGYSGGVTGGPGGNYGGGAGGCSGSPETKLSGNGGKGAVRLIWGEGRAFPATNTADQPANQGTSTAVKSYGFAPDMGFLLTSYDASGGARETFSRVSGTSSNANVGNSAMQTKWDLDGQIASVDSSWNKWPMNGGNSGGNNLGSNDIVWTWRRAKGFFDTCTWYSNGNDNEPYPHNLGAVPEMIWYRRLDGNMEGMFVYHKDFFQQSQYAATGQQGIWTGSSVWGDGTVPHTTTHFTMGNTAGNNYWNAAYLFATNPGISKVGSYETLSNGDPQNIDCGFTTGVRALLIKRMTNIPANDPSVGGWFCFDTARGMATSGATSGSTTFVSSTGDMLKIQGPNNGGGNGLQFGTGAYTIEFWIKTTANAGWIMFNAGSNTGIRISVGKNGTLGGGFNGRIDVNEQVANNDQYTESGVSVNDGQWHHVAISRPAGGQMKLWVDGAHQGTGASNGRNWNSNEDCWIGRRQSGGGYALDGQISNLRVTGSALYTAPFTPSTSPLTQTANTKLLCLQSDTDPLASTVTPGTISYTGGTMSATSDNPFSSAVSPYMRLDDKQPQTSSTWVKKTDEGFRIESGNQLNVAGGQKYIYYAIA